MNIDKYIEQYKNNLLEDVIPFWMNNSHDREHGGYFTCLNRDGSVYDTDKFIWLQCRQVWCFSMLYNRLEQKKEWLDFAIQGAEFLKKYGRDAHGDWYFSLDCYGNPLIQPYNIFSDCFAAMAFGQLYQATNDPQYGKIASDTFHRILKRKDNPKGSYNKMFPGTRDHQGFSLPMILSNLVLEIEHLLDPALVADTIYTARYSVMEVFYQAEHGLILENVGMKGEFIDSFEGRLINPGHGLEAMWFMMELASRAGDVAGIQKAVDIAINILEYGWDQEHGGIFYFMDIQGRPPQQLEWDQKLWWVHIETLVALIKGYLYTGDQRCWMWFEKVHEYTWAHFPDPEYGEWFGYLNRDGIPLVPSKGGKWKGCFHVPRGLFQCWKTLELIKEREGING